MKQFKRKKRAFVGVIQKEMKQFKRDKRAFVGVMFFVIILFLILILGFIGVITVGLFDYVGDTVTPVLSDFGVIGETNFTEVADNTVVPLNTFVQALPWLVGFAYVVMLIFSIIFVIGYESNPYPAFIGAYVFFIILIIFGSIVISNMYEDIYTGDDELADRLREQTTLSWMILYSPTILVIISLITGIYIFSRAGNQGGGI